MAQLFGTDGIRGKFGEWPLVPEFFLKLGKVVGYLLSQDSRNPSIVVGRDPRGSGEILQKALISGLLSSGVDVLDVGVLPTSAISYLLCKSGIQAGAVISASHNPVEQNGIKFFDAKGQKFPESMEGQLEALVIEDAGFKETMIFQRLGMYHDHTAAAELYTRGLLSEHPPEFLEGLTILIDCSNGAAWKAAPAVFSQTNADPIAIHAMPNGRNINNKCGSEWARRAPQELGALTRQLGANFALAFDGDADRVVFVDEESNLIDGDHMLGFLSAYLAGKNQLLGNAVVTTTMRNTGLKRYIENAGMVMHETPVGDKYVVEKLLQIRAQYDQPGCLGLGGEQAGHIDLVDDLWTTGDGIRTALFVLQAYRESGASSLAEFARGVGKTPQIIASALVGAGPRYEKIYLSEWEQAILAENPSLLRANLRYSGTEPLFRVMLEGNAPLDVMDLAKIAWKICRQTQNKSNTPSGEVDILNCTQGGVIIPAAGW